MLTTEQYRRAAEAGAEHRQPVIETIGLTRRFGSTTALDGIDLAVRRGEIYGFLGANGAGKSTLIRILCTLLVPSDGRATVGGHDVSREPQAVRLKIGAALQEAALDDRQTGRELLVFQAQLYGLGRAARRRRLGEVLDLVHIGHAIDRRIATYSGGMKRRIDLAAALIHNPEVLFLDEPTTGLDPESRAEVWQEVRHLNANGGLTVFLTTQYLDEADALAHRVGIIGGGRLICQGTPSELKGLIGDHVIAVETDGYEPSLLAATRCVDGLGEVAAAGKTLVVRTRDPMAALGPLSAELQRARIDVRGLTVRPPTLDEVFQHFVTNHRTDLVEVR